MGSGDDRQCGESGTETARRLVAEGWESTSNSYRNVARLPEGKSGLEALKEVAPDEYHHLTETIERRAANVYRRIYATEAAGTKRSLDRETFAAFKRAGGQSSW